MLAGLGAPIPLRILPLGDSLTCGAYVPGGYRAPLYQLLTNAGFSVDFLGSQIGYAVATLPDPDHEGHNGYRIDQIDANFVAWADGAADPDIILLEIGGNDYLQNFDTAHATNRLDTLISHIVAYRPTARVVVGSVIVVSNQTLRTAIETTYNPYVPGIVAIHAAQGQRVFFNDVHAAYGLADLAGGDGVHPVQSGYNKLGTNWFSAITNLITRQVLDFDTSLATNLNSCPIPSICQPIPNLTVTYQNVGLRNTGPDHTGGVTGGNRYNAYQHNGGAPQVFLFDKAVAIPSVWLTTDLGGGGASLQVTVKAYLDTNGATLLSSNSVATAAHAPGAGYVWTQFTGLAALATNVRRVEFDSGGNAQVDDMSLLVTTNWGAAPSVLVNFNDGLPADTLLLQPLPAGYQPVADLVMGCSAVSLYNGAYGGGPDHTTGVAGGNHYMAFSPTNAPAVFTFNRPVSIPSVWLTTSQGDKAGQSTNVVVRTYADAVGTLPLSTNVVPTPLPVFYWIRFAGLAPLGTVIRRVEFSPTGIACVDDMSLNLASAARPVISLDHLAYFFW